MTNTSISDVFEDTDEISLFTFNDYVLFNVLLLFSAAIGVYFGFFHKKEDTALEYLLGSKRMGVFEISMSLVSSIISGVAFLAVPADVYRYGATFWFHNFSAFFALLLSCFLVLPVFYKLNSPSIYEYLKLRFDYRLRALASFVSVVANVLFLTLTIYLPALALAQSTGFNIHFITPMICGVCIFYTTIGGLKAVVWTDALQMTIMIGASVVIIYIGIVAAGGLGSVWTTASDGGRLTFDLSLNPTKRDTVWTNFIGMFFFWTNVITLNQGCVQKLRALPTLRKAKFSHIFLMLGLWMFFHINIFTGLLIYTKFYDCDPYLSKKINAYDQILPYYIIEISGNLPGLVGVFIAGIFSAALSTLSATMNSLACMIYEDFVVNCVPKNLTQRQVNIILKILVVLVGITCYAMVFAVQNFKGMFEMAVIFNSFVQGPCTGVFILGMFIPKANSKGALTGALLAMVIMSWIVCTASYYKTQGYLVNPPKPLSTSGCAVPKNITFRLEASEPSWEPPFIYRISHYYYGLMGCLIVFFVGIPVSYLTNRNDDEVDKDLISPIMHWALKKESSRDRGQDYRAVDQGHVEGIPPDIPTWA